MSTVPGLRLAGDDRDVVVLDALVRASRAALLARWRIVRTEEDTILVADVIDSVVVAALSAAGHDAIVDVDANVVRSARVVDGLLAAVPARIVIETQAPAEALFAASTSSAATTLLEQLALLERHDARVSRSSDGRTLVRVVAPPWWLVSRVLDGVAVDVAVFAAAAPSLWTALGTRHPLASSLAAALRTQHQLGLLHADGTLETIAAPLVEVGLDDALVPELPPLTSTTTTTALTERFAVQLRLAPADGVDEPELFVVPSTSLAALTTFAEAASADELERVLVGRLGDDSGRPVYLVRELVRPALPRLGARLSTLLSSAGYARLPGPGLDGVYAPVGRRLVPVLRPAQLRSLLGLDDGGGALVLVDEDRDGLRLQKVVAPELSPMSALTSFALTDRRVVYDRLLEEMVLAWPGVQLARPSTAARPSTPTTPRSERARPTPRDKPAIVDVDTVVRIDVADTDHAQLQRDEQTLQAQVLAFHEAGDDTVDGADVADAWSRLATVKATLRSDDVIETAATALFLAADDDVARDAALSALLPTSGAAASSTLLDLATIEAPNHGEAVALCVQVLSALSSSSASSSASSPAPVDDEILHAATRAIAKDTVPLPRRLQWTTLAAIARHHRDPIALTRAKEVVLGALNTRGLTEALDLPRFVRTSLALSSSSSNEGGVVGNARAEQLVVLERALHRLVPEPLSIGDGPDALKKIIVASGLLRLGGAARPILAAIEAELPAHDGPVQVLLRLYAARLGFVMTRDDVDTADARALWKQEVQQILALAPPEDRRGAEWLIKRSRWLRTDVVADVPPGLRPSLTRRIEAAVDDDPASVDVVAAIVDVPGVAGAYDFEVAAAVERLLQVAMRTGRDDVIVGSAAAAVDVAASLKILAHRARLLGAAVKAAATVPTSADAEGVIARCLDEVAAIAGADHVPGIRDLLLAIRPALVALRRFGRADAARRFIAAFVPLTDVADGHREPGPLAAALAEGAWQLGDHALATSLIERAMQRVWEHNTPHVDRFDAGAAVLAALAHQRYESRFAVVEQFVDRLGRFGDTFTTSRWYPTHQILLAERVVDCLVDDSTVRSDALQGFLDDDESRVRRRVLANWRRGLAGR